MSFDSAVLSFPLRRVISKPIGLQDFAGNNSGLAGIARWLLGVGA